MSAGPNLIPSPSVIAFQGVVFYLAYCVVKYLYVEPYMALRAKRVRMTSGSEDITKSLILENEAMVKAMDEKINSALNKCRASTQQLLASANTKKAEAVRLAQLEAQKEVEKLVSEINSEVQEQKSKLPSLVDQLAESVRSKVLGG